MPAPALARHAHAAHLGPVAQRVAHALRQLVVRLRHHHLAGLNPHGGADGGNGEDARLHQLAHHLHPLGGDDEPRAHHHAVGAHHEAHAEQGGSGRSGSRGSDNFIVETMVSISMSCAAAIS